MKATRIRILFKTGESEYRRFYWFELKEKDLYWGPGSKTAVENTSVTFSTPNEGQISIPETLEFAKKTEAKYSYHESGKVHLKKLAPNESPIYEDHSTWKLKDEITELTRFFAIITKPVLNYELYNKKLDSGGSKPFIIDTANDVATTRLYIELFISPIGTFSLPPSILEGHLIVAQQIRLNENLSLIIALNHFKGIDEWHEDKEIIFVPENI
ncbi:hypothetical protein [Flavobacterium limi]|uniref:Uncharacterized protein n=1 Tax=Flavobacterium limi TaxID=2045105 RepID=A0ABQ1UQN1_9FLAO|nr:hypothetical protein [Flavobacterium limi]GGF24218.1 hypothetical protein GCM10011518_36920 [Flavobacterium limi]